VELAEAQGGSTRTILVDALKRTIARGAVGAVALNKYKKN
jgi:hypothetical protein